MSGSAWKGPIYAENGFRVGTKQSSVPLISQLSGDVYYVDSVNGADGNDGLSWAKALATIDAAIGKCTANNGDMIYVAAGHAETLTAKITADIAGVSIIGLGNGNNRPSLTVGGTIDGVDITANDVVIENLRFVTPSAAATADVNVAAARSVIRGCRFELGANAVDPVTVTADGERPVFEYNEVQVTADGPDDWIVFEGVVDHPVIRHNLVIGSDGTNAFDDGAINYGSQAVTNPMVYDNNFDGQGVATVVVVNNASVVGELMGPNTYAGSATSADNVSSQQEIIDALYGTSGIATFPNAAVPANSVSLAEVLRSVWAGLMGTAAGENGIATWPAAAAPANDVSLAEAIRYIVETQVGTLTNTGGTATIGGILGDVSNTSVATNLAKLGTMTNSGGTATLGAMIGDMANVALATRLSRVTDALYDTAGVASWSAAAVPANGVSLSEALRYAIEQQLWRLETKAYTFAGQGGAQGAINLFTVTGDVEVELFGIAKASFTSGGVATIEVGVSGNTAVLIAQSTATDLLANEIWHDATPTTTVESISTVTGRRFVISNGQDIILTIGTAATTAGDCTFYCRWRPLSSDGAVVAA